MPSLSNVRHLLCLTPDEQGMAWEDKMLLYSLDDTS